MAAPECNFICFLEKKNINLERRQLGLFLMYFGKKHRKVNYWKKELAIK